MVATDQSDEPASSHGNLLADIIDIPAQVSLLPDTPVPSWSFPNLSTLRPSPPVALEGSSSTPSIYTQRANTRPIPDLDAASTTSNLYHSSLFTTPNRSIFSSGPPTTSVSANTAHAMNAPQSGLPSRPLSSLATPSSSSTRRSVHYRIDEASVCNNTIVQPEKENDDPSTPPERSRNAEMRDSSTPTALTRLFTTAEPETPTISRHASYMRTHSGTTYTRGK